MTVPALLADLTRRGIKIAVSGDQLDVRAPKGALSPALRGEIASRKAEILRYLSLRDARGAVHELQEIVPDRARLHEPFPLTDIQQAYWVGRSALFAQGDISIHCYLEIDCKRLDVARLESALERVVAQHDMLRAIILPEGQQRILPEVPAYRIEATDHRHRRAEDTERELLDVRERMSHQVFPTDEWPPFEIRASILDEETTRIHLSIDLVSIDGGSLMIFLQDLSQCYLAPEKPLPKLEVSYRDYVLAEQALQATSHYQISLQYWRERIKDLPPPPELPLAMNPAALTKTRFRRRHTTLAPEAWSRLVERAAMEGLSPSAVLLTAYAEVLATWSKHPRFTINITLFNRLPFHLQVNQLIGDFTSIVMLGIDCSSTETFVERAHRAQAQLWTDLEHRHVSGIQVLRELRAAQGGRHAAMPFVFTSMLNLGGQGYRPPSATMKALGKTAYMLTQTPQVWIDCQSHLEEDGALAFHWDFVEDLFPQGMMDEMFDAYCALLGRMATDEGFWQERTVRRVPLPAREVALRAEVNATDAPEPEQVLPELLAARAAETPDRPAVLSLRRTLRYGELFRRANHLSHRLVGLGCRSRLVAVVMEKGWEQVVAVYGIHSAAATYLPIDVESPPDRLAYLLAQGEVTVALTQPHIDARLTWPEGITRLVLEEDEPSGPEAEAPAALPQPGDLAYVLYTSGSTGKPKGVMIEHRSVVNRIFDVNDRFTVGPEDRAIALTTLHHDLSVYDLFGMVAAGGAIVVPDAASARDPLHWADLMNRFGVTLWNSVPAFMEMMVDALEHEAGRPQLDSLRLVLLAGDWIPVTLPRRLWTLAPEARFISLGGPTETTVWDICYPVESVDSAWQSIPYGKPMKNARYHVLNESLEACPTWVPGELYIGGTGLARGYYRDEERTRERFLTHPKTGERMYRSGDMGRYLPDGNIEFLGREDFQIKILGQRIELGEIEVTLAMHPSVRTAVATVATAASGGRRLVAYVVPADAGALSVKEATAAVYASFAPSTEETIVDPVARAEFKLNRHGLRRLDGAELSFDLGKPQVDEALVAQYMHRSSRRAFDEAQIALERLGKLLACLVSIGVDGLPKYRYGSAGGLYPVQVYVYVKPERVSGLPGGIYYHHPEDHRLVLVSSEARLGREIHGPANHAIFDASAFSIFLVGRMSAIRPMYGEFARDFCVLEAGYIGQLLMTEAPAAGIGLCPVGGYVAPEKVLAELAGAPDDILLHSLLGGGVARGAASREAADPGSLAEDLTRFLARKLPRHMIPKIVLREALPLTANGKVDRRALTEIALEDAAPPPALVPPANEIEETLSKIVQEVLELERVSVRENFFDLGANSRHIVQLIGKIRQALGVDVRLTDAFKFPTVSALASHLGHNTEDQGAATAQGRSRAEMRRAARRR